MAHDVLPFANGLSAKLAARSRHVCVFLGAGASRACGLPDVAALQTLVRDGLSGGQRAAFDAQLARGNLEQALSRLRRIEVLLEGSSDRVDDLESNQAAALDREICRLIVEALDVATADASPMMRFAAWAARADYRRPVELFTVNYDLLLETALEALAVPYFDGFVGALRARFRTHLVEASESDGAEALPAFLLRLWKLHGSVHWTWTSGPPAEVVRLGAPVAGSQAAAIYPSDAKYDESRRVPFVVLQDRLRRALEHPETITLVTGYAFGDAHLNELMFDAAVRRPRSEIIAFCFDQIPDELAVRATTTPNLQALGAREAIISGVRAPWTQPADAPEDLWDDGTFRLGDFASLATFLARSSPPQGELEARLSALLTTAASAPGA